MRWRPWLIGLATVLGASVLFGSLPNDDIVIDSAGRDELLGLLDTARTPDDWRIFFDATAHGESRWNSDVGLGDAALAPAWARMNTSQSEARASCVAYDRQRDRGRLAGSGYARSRYCFGSGGFFAMLPANAIAGAFRGSALERLDPYAVFDPRIAVVMAVDYARRLLGWSAFKQNPTWLTLRVGWSNPSLMADPAFRAKVRQRFTKSLRAIGVSPSWMDRRVTSMGWYPGARTLFGAFTGREVAGPEADPRDDYIDEIPEWRDVPEPDTAVASIAAALLSGGRANG